MTACPTVGEWMTPHPTRIRRDTLLLEAHNLVRERRVRPLPVVDRQNVVGIVTVSAVRTAEPSTASSLSTWGPNPLLGKLPIHGVMSQLMTTISAQASMSEAAELMLEKRIAGLPGMDGWVSVGVRTVSDIFRMVVARWERPAERAAA